MEEKTAVGSVSPEYFIELLKKKGYGAERLEDVNGQPALRSYSMGLGYDIFFGNPVEGKSGQYYDASFQLLIDVQEEMPLSIVNMWNTQHRFARLYLLEGDKLNLALDVLVYGGATEQGLIAKIEMWDYMVQALASFLQDYANELRGKGK